METIEFEYPATKRLPNRAHVGVVSSGDLEVLIEPGSSNCARVRIRTSIPGYQETWRAIFERFFLKHNIAAIIEINDAGATPGRVALRLEQALEASEE